MLFDIVKTLHMRYANTSTYICCNGKDEPGHTLKVRKLLSWCVMVLRKEDDAETRLPDHRINAWHPDTQKVLFLQVAVPSLCS